MPWFVGTFPRFGSRVSSRFVEVYVRVIGCHGPAVMEEMDAVDYSSDRLEGTDIWEVSGGVSLDLLADFPRAGLDGAVTECNKPLGLETVYSPSEFYVSPPVDHASVEFLVDPLQQRSEGLLGPSVCPDAGDLLGLSPSILQGGLVDEVGCAQVLLGGNGGQGWRGQFSSAETSEEELKVPLNVAEHRGCSSPNRVFDADCLGAPGECVGR